MEPTVLFPWELIQTADSLPAEDPKACRLRQWQSVCTPSSSEFDNYKLHTVVADDAQPGLLIYEQTEGSLPIFAGQNNCQGVEQSEWRSSNKPTPMSGTWGISAALIAWAMFHLCIVNPTPQTARERGDTVLGWVVECTPRIDRNQVAARHTMYHAAETAASGSNSLTRRM